jgi:hypothetical protein
LTKENFFKRKNINYDNDNDNDNYNELNNDDNNNLSKIENEENYKGNKKGSSIKNTIKYNSSERKALLNEKGEKVIDEDGNIVYIDDINEYSYIYNNNNDKKEIRYKSRKQNDKKDIEIKPEILKDEVLKKIEKITNKELKEIKNPLTEEDIDKMLQEKKSILNSHLLKVLKEEKFKEEERDLLYSNTYDLLEKKRLEKIISMERAQSSERISSLNR